MNPKQVAEMLAANRPDEVFDTGLISPDTLRVWRKGTKRVVCGYRRPQVTGIWLEGSEEPLRVPLPGLVMIRSVNENRTDYRILAVKKYPTEKVKAYIVPLPNVGSMGVCWGTVSLPDRDALMASDLQPDWAQFLGTQFGNHSVQNKCKRYPDDVRKLLSDLHDTSRFPNDELMPMDKSVWDILTQECK